MINNISIEDDNKNCNTFKNNNKNKIAILIIILLTICILFLSKVLSFSKDPDNIVYTFQQAIVSNEVNKLKSILYCNDNRLKLDKDTLSNFLNYFDDNPSYLNTLVNDLNLQADTYKNKDINSFSIDKSSKLFTLQKTKINKYRIYVKPLFYTINVPIKGANITINNDELLTSNSNNFSKEIGPIFPAKYTFTASYEGEFTSFEDSIELDFISLYKNEDNFNINLLDNFKNNSIIVHGDIDEAKVYINGIEFKSNVITYNGQSKDIYLNFDKDLIFSPIFKNEESIKKEISSLIEDYLSNMPNAITYNDFSYISPYLQANSKLYKNQRENIEHLYENKLTYKFISSSIKDIELDNSKLNFIAKVSEIYEISNDSNVISETTYNKYIGSYDKKNKKFLLHDLSKN